MTFPVSCWLCNYKIYYTNKSLSNVIHILKIDLGHVQIFSFSWEDCCCLGRNQNCTDIPALSPGAKMAILRG